jgi:hypothetical protein
MDALEGKRVRRFRKAKMCNRYNSNERVGITGALHISLIMPFEEETIIAQTN